MSLDQAIKHGKEHRKPYHGRKAADVWCRNHNYCRVCRKNRLHKSLVEQIKAKEELGGKNGL